MMAVSIEPEQEKVLLNVTAYHRRDFDLIAIRSPPCQHALVLQSLAQPFLTSPTSSLGSLKCLPIEVISVICLCLDVQSYIRFRQVSRLARDISSRLREYKAIVKYGLESLRAVLRTGIATFLTLCDIYYPLCVMECAICNSFGGFLFLPTATRCCFTCLESSPDLYVASLSALSKASKLSPNRLRRLVPVLHTIPGVYSLEEKTCNKRLRVVAGKVALETLCALGVWPGSPNATLKPLRNDAVLRFMVSTALPYLDKAAAEAQDGISCKGCQVAVEATRVDVAAYDRRDQVYSKKGFLDHFQLCTEAQVLWSASCGGTVAFDEPEFTKRCGFLSKLDCNGYPR